MSNYGNKEILGYDCDENPINEYRVLRFPFSFYVENWDEEPDIDPRLFCLVKNSKDEVFAVSVYDDWHSRYIRRFENLTANEEIPILIKTVEDMAGYEVAFSGIDGTEWYYDRDKSKIKKIVDSISEKEKSNGKVYLR